MITKIIIIVNENSLKNLLLSVMFDVAHEIPIIFIKITSTMRVLVVFRPAAGFGLLTDHTSNKRVCLFVDP